MIRIKQHLSTCFSFLVNKSFSGVAHRHLQVTRYCLLCSQRIPEKQSDLAASPRAYSKNTNSSFSADICWPCLTDLPWNITCCSCCALPVSTKSGHLCGECLKNEPGFDKVVCPFRFEFPIDQIVRNFKYQGKRFYSQILWQSLAISTMASGLDPNQPPLDAIIPVPQDPDRARARPYNHTLRLASELSRESGVPLLESTIRKTKSSKAQAGLNKKARLNNLKNCFETSGQIPKRVVLVDDVVTSGATAEVLSRLLKSNGAEYVEVWAIARTPKPRTKN